jgi:hypothetical protein
MEERVKRDTWLLSEWVSDEDLVDRLVLEVKEGEVSEFMGLLRAAILARMGVSGRIKELEEEGRELREQLDELRADGGL